MKRLLGEPLLYFVLAVAAVFVTYGLVSGRAVPRDRIVIGRADIASMVTGFSRTWQRPPTREELDGLIEDRLREEVGYREAIALGLDRDDAVIRRQLRQKLESAASDVAALAEPTEADLVEYLTGHSELFRARERLTFDQVYLSPDRHGDRLAQDAARLLARLRQAGRDADLSSIGDPFLLERRLEGESTDEIAQQFGEEFVQRLRHAPIGLWDGPIASSYGVHLVFVEERTDGRMPALAEVRDAVRREWVNTRRLEANEKYFQALLKRYVVTVERQPMAALTHGGE
jgi:hypothetical protein